VLIPPDTIQVQAEHGWLTLSGEVDWDYQRTAAIDDLRKLRGVVGISNNIRIRPRPAVADVQRRIEAALKRSAAIQASHVQVTAHGGDVKLEGRVGSWADRYAIEKAAWSVPGVRAVHDHTHVG